MFKTNATTPPVLEKDSEFERMCGYNWYFMTENDHLTNRQLQLEAN